MEDEVLVILCVHVSILCAAKLFSLIWNFRNQLTKSKLMTSLDRMKNFKNLKTVNLLVSWSNWNAFYKMREAKIVEHEPTHWKLEDRNTSDMTT